jgi:hypothetical protein
MTTPAHLDTETLEYQSIASVPVLNLLEDDKLMPIVKCSSQNHPDCSHTMLPTEKTKMPSTILSNIITIIVCIGAIAAVAVTALQPADEVADKASGGDKVLMSALVIGVSNVFCVM